VGKRLERRARACLFLSAFSRSHLDISGPADEAVCHQTRKVFVHGRPTVSISPSRRCGLSKKKG
jgi:hypothetical protein